MSIETFNVKEQWIGTGDLAVYTFDFKIAALTELLLILQDTNGLETARYRGDDTSFISGVVFDASEGGGTVTLIDVLPDSYIITALMANDAPTQPSQLRNKFAFTLINLELALDYIVGPIQRLAYLAARSLKLHDLDDVDVIDLTLPQGFADNPGAMLAVNADGDGLEYGPTTGSISGAQAFAEAAEASEDAAVISAAAAAVSAAAAAASAGSAASGFYVSGTKIAPLDITAAGGITSGAQQRQFKFIHGSPGAVTISANPQISAGVTVGQEMALTGCDDTNNVTFTNGNGLLLNGDCTLNNDEVLCLVWDGTKWSELYRR